MNSESRVYGENINISKSDIKNFWNKRAEKYNYNMPYSTVELNDHNNEYVEKLNHYEKKVIIPKLNINKYSRVLDIGCGIGRLAEDLIEISEYYLGVDMSEKLIDIAKKRIDSKKNYDFIVSDFDEIHKIDILRNFSTFNIVILSGVNMYINDKELINCFKNIINLLDKKCLIYISDPIAVKERLTLNNFYSNQLQSYYSVIYRTEKEYIDLFNIFFKKGFKIEKKESFLLEEKQYSETQRHYFILSRDI